jgi:citrate synthase
VRAFSTLDRLGCALDLSDPMDALRATAAHNVELGDAESTRMALTGALAVYASAWRRGREGLSAVEPDPTLSHAEDYLRMNEGAAVRAERAAALDTYFVTVAEHGMNASTFAARLVTSTRSDAVSAIVAAIGALKGPAHGGAPGPVLDMIRAIGSPERAREWIERTIESGQRIMGMGHRVYRARDPRAAVLEGAIERLEAAGVAPERLELARAVEEVALDVLRRRKPGRALEANVEFYTAILLDAVGLPQPLFTPTFAVARVAGWLAHSMEEAADGRLIRPNARYIGPVPVEQPSSIPDASRT